MRTERFAVRVIATVAGVSGAVVLAVSIVLALLWTLDASGPAGSAGELLGALAFAAAGSALLLVARLAGRRVRPADISP